MKWQEVSYALHGWRCTVLFDRQEEPEVIKRFDGTIECPTAGAAALLKNVEAEQIMMPPPWATVVIFPEPMQIGVWENPPQRKR